jgi:hypothetical protein
MIKAALLCVICSLGWAQENEFMVDRVGATGFLQLQAAGFESLKPREQQLAYWLSQASIAINPIIYDQLSRFGLRQKRVLEMIVANRKASMAPHTTRYLRSPSFSGRIAAIITRTLRKNSCPSLPLTSLRMRGWLPCAMELTQT